MPGCYIRGGRPQTTVCDLDGQEFGGGWAKCGVSTPQEKTLVTRFALFSLVVSALLSTRVLADGSELNYRENFIRGLAAGVPNTLKTQDPKTGRFGTGIWIVNDQNVMFPLAAAWATESPDNPYFHDQTVLEAIVKAGDALIEDADESGQGEFRKKDGSTWGKIYMPWTYSAWIKAYSLVREGMTPEQREHWDKALIRGYTNIARTQLAHVHNIPTNHAMGLYIAGQVFDRPEWRQQAKEFMAKVIAEQNPAGFWSENHGPVIMYGSVYTDALGTYYALSKDDTVLPAIEKAVRFYSSFIYPDGSAVETIDERNPYHGGLRWPNVAFTLTAEGRGFIKQQLDLLVSKGHGVAPDNMAPFIVYGQEGSAVPTAAGESDRTFALSDGKALIRRKGPWFVCLSAYCCPLPKSRWIQDRQNLASIWHDHVGLIAGGGNTKLQPLWSCFTVGDTSLLKHRPGDIAPNFMPAGPLFHVPTRASIKQTDPIGLNLKYGGERCHLFVETADDDTAYIHQRSTAVSGLPVEGHITLLPRLGEALRTGKAPERVLGEEPFVLTAEEAGGWIAHGGWKLSLPEGSKVIWPALPHNPYVKDGAAKVHEGRIVVSIPFTPERGECVLKLEISDQ